MNPGKNAASIAGAQLGRVSLWTDRTEEVAIEEEVGELVETAAQDDFSQRLILAGKEGFMRQLAEGINRIMETTHQGINEVAQMLKALADGNLAQHMTGNFQGQFARLQHDANATVEQLREIVPLMRNSAPCAIRMLNSMSVRRTWQSSPSPATGSVPAA